MAASQAHRGLRGSAAAKTAHQAVVRAGPCLICATRQRSRKSPGSSPRERQRNDETRIDRLPCPMGAHYGLDTQ